jgi:EAL domain-containing protein (putative c-di-GMP-specific phosphodiesterase class I)
VAGFATLVLAARADGARERAAAAAVAAGHAVDAHGALLLVRGERVALDGLAERLAGALRGADAAAVRMVVLGGEPLSAPVLDVLAPAMLADSLATLAAKTAHGTLLDALEASSGVNTVFQPIVDLRTEATTGFEALLRLEHEGRSVPPLEVFGAAADAGRLRAADGASRRAAILAASGWIGPRSLFLNLHAIAVEHPSAFDDTDAAVEAAGLRRDQLVFETPAPIEVDDVRHVVRVLEHLRDRGYRIGLDDASDDPGVLRLIERLRPDHVKIDRSLIAELPALQARSAVATVVGAAHAAGATVVAKGLETAAQVDAVVFVGVDGAQGWQVGQPMRPPSGRPARVGR